MNAVCDIINRAKKLHVDPDNTMSKEDKIIISQINLLELDVKNTDSILLISLLQMDAVKTDDTFLAAVFQKVLYPCL